MKQTELQNDEIIFPSIVFKLNQSLYSIGSRHVVSIMQLPEYQLLPDAPPSVLGMMLFRGEAVPLLDLRSVFGQPTLKQENEAFNAMLEARKQDHIHWVTELERCTMMNEPFPLATDPHQCAFGKWYDHYQSDSHTINFHLKKIDEPHRLLHQAALDVERCSHHCESCERDECLKTILERAKASYVPTIVNLLDSAKELFKDAYREMVLVLKDRRSVGIVVDEVLSVEDLSDLGGEGGGQNFQTGYVRAVKKSVRNKDVILELDEERLLGQLEEDAVSA